MKKNLFMLSMASEKYLHINLTPKERILNSRNTLICNSKSKPILLASISENAIKGINIEDNSLQCIVARCEYKNVHNYRLMKPIIFN